MSIRLVPREEIDKIKWNSCVHYATNGSIFGYMWYLDATARHWDALVEGDYESVMPLTYASLRWGNEGLIQPPLIRELAIYSVNPPSDQRNQAFWDALPDKYKVIDLQLDSFSSPKGDQWQKAERTNYYLPLASEYEQVSVNFTPELTEKLAVAMESDLFPSSSLKPERIAELYRQENGPIKEEVFHGLQRIMYNLLHRGWGFATGVMNREKELLAADFFVFSHGRVMSLAPSVTAAGQQVYAKEHLYDAIIRNFAGKPQALDFNTAPGEDDFAKRFGALNYEYFDLQQDTRRWKWL